MTETDDSLYLGNLVVSIEDGEIALVAYWSEYTRKSVVMVASVIDCRVMDN